MLYQVSYFGQIRSNKANQYSSHSQCDMKRNTCQLVCKKCNFNALHILIICFWQNWSWFVPESWVKVKWINKNNHYSLHSQWHDEKYMPNVVQQYNFNVNEHYNRCGRLHLVFVTDLYLTFELIMLTLHAE